MKISPTTRDPLSGPWSSFFPFSKNVVNSRSLNNVAIAKNITTGLSPQDGDRTRSECFACVFEEGLAIGTHPEVCVECKFDRKGSLRVFFPFIEDISQGFLFCMPSERVCFS